MGARRVLSRAALACCAVGAAVAIGGPTAQAATPPVVEGEWVLNVSGSSATLAATVNPGGSETTYHFEYDTSEYGTPSAHGQSVPLPDESAGAGSTAVTVQVHPQNLLASTTYHFRVVATNAEGTTFGADRAFTTQASGGAFSLPDGREWELVSPAEKHGTQILPTSHHIMEASEEGSAIAYYATGPFAGESSSGNAGKREALSHRDATGWSTQDIGPHYSTPSISTNTTSEYQAFSPDLARAVAQPNGYTPQSPEARERTIYLRDNATGLYTPLIYPGDVKPGFEFNSTQFFYFIAASPDLNHVVLETPEEELLTVEDGAEAGLRASTGRNYYEWTDGRLQLINLLPANHPYWTTSGNAVIGGYNDSVNENTRHAVSEDGSRVFWSTNAGTGGVQLFMRDLAAGDSIRVNTAQGVAEPEHSDAVFQIASKDGSKVFFTEPGQLTTTPGGGLYVYEVDTGRMTLLTVPLSSGESPGVDGENGDSTGAVIGESEDGSYVYFVATGVLSANENERHEKAVSGEHNLYVVHEETSNGVPQWSTRFIAVLSNQDGPSWAEGRGGWLELGHLTSRVSPDGRYLAFMSNRSLTGYDNLDANSGQPDEEVYEYDAQSGRLACASCDPTGARPVGLLEGPNASLADLTAAWGEHWVAASIPGNLEQGSNDRYEPRSISDTGRLFFDSPDALVPQDVNGVGDVYQYEPSEIGSCKSPAGCVSLISGGAGSEQSLFVDASASGEDVFFVTADRLVGEDFDNGYDMYDAHVCNAQASCFPPQAAVPPPCDTGASCEPAPSPQPSAFGSPASATFAGAGNIVAAAGRLVAAKHTSSALSRMLRVCRRERDSRKRTVCERHARRAYGKQAVHRAQRAGARINGSRRAGL